MRKIDYSPYKWVPKSLSVAVFILFSLSLSAQVTISTVTPLAGAAGSTVTLTGNNFDPVAGNDIVYFGPVRAAVSSASATSLSVVVPTGAGFQPISVTVSGYTAYSEQPFILTFPEGGGLRLFPGNTFTNAKNIGTEADPGKSAMGDIDGDGKPDVVISEAGTMNVSLYRNTSSGTTISFAAGMDIALPSYAQSVAIADVDGDGKLDIIAGTADHISILLNTSTNGTISFAQRVDIATTFVGILSVADMDKDGKPDVIIVNDLSILGILRNTSSIGSVSFAPIVSYTIEESYENCAVGDIDGDGLPDVAVTNSGYNTLSIFQNASTPGTIVLKPKIDISTGSGPFDVAIADFDGDGKPDLAISNANDKTISILQNTGAIGSISFLAATSVSTGSNPVRITAGDINGDGRPDLAEVNDQDGSVNIFENLSSIGTFSFSPPVGFATGVQSYSIELGDLNGDGPPELVVLSIEGNSMTVLFNNVTAPNLLALSPSSGGPHSVIVIKGTHLTGATAVSFGGTPAASFSVVSDSVMSAVVGSGNSGVVKVTTPFGTATLSGFNYTTLPVITAFSPESGEPGSTVSITGVNFTGTTSVRFGTDTAKSFQISGDTLITAVTGRVSPGSLFVFVTTPNGTDSLANFYSGPAIGTISPTIGYTGESVVIDGSNFNASPSANTVYFGAVKATVTAATTNSLTATVPAGATFGPVSVIANKLAAYSNQSFAPSFIGTSTGFTATSFAPQMIIAGVNYPSGNVVGDLDGDGKPDIVFSNMLANTISFLRNTSSGGIVSFAPRVDMSAGAYPGSVTLGDLNRDGKLDLVVMNTSDGTISVFQNTSSVGSISFSASADYPGGGLGCTIMDLDGDGLPDIITVRDDGTLLVYPNISKPGTLSFGNSRAYSVGLSAENVVSGDIDGDGKPDILVANSSSNSGPTFNTVSVLRNTSTVGNISFAPQVTIPAGEGPIGISVGDLDGDGKLDLATANANIYDQGGYTVSVMKNTSTPGVIAFAPQTQYHVRFRPVSVTMADLDGDRKLDLAVTAQDDDSISVLKNTSTVGALSFAPAVSYGIGAQGQNVTAADLNADGKPDLIVCNATSENLSILVNQTSASPTAPVVTAFSPDTANTGTRVVITGVNLNGATAVSFGGVAASSFTVLSADSIRAVVGAGASGNVAVTTPDGSADLPGFVFNANAPVITSFSPMAAAQSDTIYITGTNLSSVTSVTIGGTAATNFTQVSSTLLAVVVPLTVSGDIIVTTTNGSADASGFTFIAGPGTFTLLQFTGTPVNNQVLLQWQVQNDQSIGAYVLAHSTDSVLFTNIDQQSPTGTGTNQYSFTDPGPSIGNNYYQLAITDLAGNTSQSKTINVIVPLTTNAIKVSPNPVKGMATITFPPSSEAATLQLTDLQGNTVRTIAVPPNTAELQVDFTGIASGLYILRWQDSSRRSTKTIMVAN